MANSVLDQHAWPRALTTLTLVCGIAMGYSRAAHTAEANDSLSCQARSYAVQDTTGTPSVSWPKQAPVQALDMACWVNPAQLAESASSKPIILDVRPRAARQSSPIAGALQMELSEVANKRFLQQEPLVLVGTGVDYMDLTAACQQLKRQGFAKVRVMQGGYAAWRAGASEQHRWQFQPISARDWIGSLSQGLNWIVLAIGSAVLKAPADRIPVPMQQLVDVVPGKAAQRAPAGDAASDAEQLASALARIYQETFSTQSNPALPIAAIVVADDAMSDTQRLHIEQSLAKVGSAVGTAIYWLQGGWHAYEQQVVETAAIQRTAHHKLQAPCGRI